MVGNKGQDSHSPNNHMGHNGDVGVLANDLKIYDMYSNPCWLLKQYAIAHLAIIY
jgi:hypothetical protein